VLIHHEHEDVRRMQAESWSLRYDLHRLFIENQRHACGMYLQVAAVT